MATTWIEEAFECGRKCRREGWAGSKNTLRRILSDPAPSGWVKWWRCGYNHPREEAMPCES
jgi:hypothetical protein